MTRSSSHYTVSWSAPTNEGGSAITHYRVEFNNSGTWESFASGEAAAPSTSLGETNAAFTPLTRFRVRARNTQGLGTPSAEATIAPGPVRDLRGWGGERRFLESDRHIRIAWARPRSQGSDVDAGISGYQVQWRKYERGRTPPPWTPVTPDLNDPHTTTGYELGDHGAAELLTDFRVRARNRNAEGPWREITVAGRPDWPETVVFSASSTPTTLTWSWSELPESIPVTGYILQLRKFVEGQDTETGWGPSRNTTAAETAVRRVTFTDMRRRNTELTPNTEYEFRIWAAITAQRFSTPGPVQKQRTLVARTATITATSPAPLTEENLDGAELTVELAPAPPVAWVASPPPKAVTVAGVPGVTVASVVRTPGRFREATVTLAHDGSDFDANARLTLSVGAAAWNENEDLTTPAVPVTATVEPAGVTVDTDSGTEGAQTALTVTEGATATYTVVLDEVPAGQVVVDVTSTHRKVTVQPASLAFTATSWDDPRTVTVRAAQDADPTDDTATLAHTIDDDRTGADYDPVTIEDLTVTVLDEVPGQVTGVAVVPGAARLLVKWNAVPGASAYKVQWRSGGEIFDTAQADGRQATVPGDRTTYIIPGLTAGTEYTVRVIATRPPAAEGQPSAELTGTPTAAAPPSAWPTRGRVGASPSPSR